MKRMIVFVGIVLALGGGRVTAAPIDAVPEKVKPAISLNDYTLTNWTEEQGPLALGIYAIAQDHEGYLWLGTTKGLLLFDGSEFVPWRGRNPIPEHQVSALLAARDGSLWVGFENPTRSSDTASDIGNIGGVAWIVGDTARHFTSRAGMAAGDVKAIVQDPHGTIWVASHDGLSEYDGQGWRVVGEDEGLPRTTVVSVWCDAQGGLLVSTVAGIYRRSAGERLFTLVDPLFTLADPTDYGHITNDLSGMVWVTDPHQSFQAAGVPRRGVRPLHGPSGVGRRLLIDRSGALWVGTRGAGLIRVPGSDRGLQPELLERLTRRQGLVSDEVFALFQDDNGNLWIGSRRGLSRLSESSIRSVVNEAGSNSFVTAVAVTRDGAVWTATATGLTRKLGAASRTFAEPDGLPSRNVTALHVDQSGSLWAATTLGVARLVDQQFVAFSILPGATKTAHQIRSITSQRDGTLWLCDRVRGLFRWKDGTVESLGALVGQREAYVVYADRADRVWVGFWEGGLSVYDRGSITTYSAEHGLPLGSVNVIFEDRSGGLWVGTERGLGRVDGQRIRTFADNGLPQEGVVSIIEDQTGDFWIASRPSLMNIDPVEFESAARDPNYQLQYRMYGVEDGLPGAFGRPGVPTGARTADGKLLFVTAVGLTFVDPRRLNERPPPKLVRVSSVSANGQEVKAQGGTITIPARTTRLAIKYSALNLAATKSQFRHKLEGFDADWQYVGETREVRYTDLPSGAYTFQVAFRHDGVWLNAPSPLEISILPAFYETRMFYGGASSSLALLLWYGWRRRVRHIKREFDLVLAERTRVGREIHDTLLQSLVAVALEFDDISEQIGPTRVALKAQVISIRTRVEECILEARQSISNLRSPMLEHSDLVTMLKRSGETASTHQGIRFEFALRGTARRLDETLEEQLLRIGQEAVSNAVQHGSASVIRMELCFEPAAVRLRVSDDGCGFDTDQPSRQAYKHWGIAGMRERAEKIGAQLRLVSQRGAGTTVEALVSPTSITKEWRGNVADQGALRR